MHDWKTIFKYFPEISSETTVTSVSFATGFSTKRLCNIWNSNSFIFWNFVFDILIFYVFFYRKPLLLNFCIGNITDQLGVPTLIDHRKINHAKQCLTLFVILWNNRYRHWFLIFWLFFGYFCHKSCKWCIYRFLHA